MLIPSLLLKQLYTFGSLKNSAEGVQFSLKNRLSDAKFTGIEKLVISGQEVPLSSIKLRLSDGTTFDPSAVSADAPIDFPLRKSIDIISSIDHLKDGKHSLVVHFRAKPFGKLKLKVDGSISKEVSQETKIPRDDNDDYSEEAIKARQKFVEEFSGAPVNHIKHYSFDPHITAGNVEHFTGVAQVPIGFAGPVNVDGKHAQGDFIIPLATAEGTLVASYNRGIKVVNLCGGARCTITGDSMQRAPVYEFEDARVAHDFVEWVTSEEIHKRVAQEAESTSSVAKLQNIDPYLASKFAFLRFNFHTGDAAGQNMVGRATFAAGTWIYDAYNNDPENVKRGYKIKKFYLESNLATDKKASQVNIMRTRGKRVVAECTLKKEVLNQYMRVEPEQLFHHYNISNIGAILSGANNNGLHSANAITAMFIATGQDVANVSESSAGILYTELVPRDQSTWKDPSKPENDLYISITIPSLIVATYGGGTSLATQKECLELLGCYGKGKVRKLAEIIAAVVLAGEISLASAISSLDWVSSHEQYGRNR